MQECNWICSDTPRLFYCNGCDRLRQWNRFAQAYSYYVIVLCEESITNLEDIRAALVNGEL